MTALKLLRTNPAHPDFIALIRLLDADLALRDGEDHAFYAQYNALTDIPYALLAYADDKPCACGALKPFGESQLELKRMFVHPDHRRQGIAQQLLSHLETWAQVLGATQLVLETGVRQPEAIALYTKAGFRRMAKNYGQYADVVDSLCFEKFLS